MRPHLPLILSALYCTAQASVATHQVRPGDTLSELALKHDLSVAQLKAYNNLQSDVIQVGQTLRLRLQAPENQTQQGARPLRHLIRRGDTLSGLAQRYDVSVQTLKRINNLESDTILLGQWLTVDTGATLRNAAERPSPWKRRETPQAQRPHGTSPWKYINEPTSRREALAALPHLDPGYKTPPRPSNSRNWKEEARRFLGTKYVFGGENELGIDCSALVMYALRKSDVRLPRVSREQARYGRPVSPDQLRSGDLVFFSTDEEQPGVITHVGIYYGGGLMINANARRGRVLIEPLNTSYWQERLVSARRVL